MKKIALLVGSFALGALAKGDDLYENTSYLSYERFGIGAQAGTLGYGLHLTYDITHYLYFKAEFNTATYDTDLDLDDAEGQGSLDFSSAGITLNYNPLRFAPILDGFRLTAGFFAVDNRIEVVVSDSSDPVEIGSISVPVGPNDALTGQATYDSAAPYLGIGWDWMIGSKDQFTFSIDVGALFTGTPETVIEANDSLRTTIARITGSQQAVDQVIADEKAQYDEDIEDFSIYPVVKLAVAIRF